MTKDKLVPLIKIVIGNIFMAFAYAKWMKPNQIINGGVTSIAMILAKVTSLPLLYLTNGVTVLLLAICYLFLGKGNFLRSLVSSCCYMALFSLFYSLPFEATVNLPVDFLFASLFIAIGYYCCISSDASTVGMDVIALAIHKRRPEVKVAVALRYINLLVLGVGLLTYGWFAITVGVVFSFVNSYMLNLCLSAHEKGILV
ncbi:YitT family protein [Vagococcus sp. BWB3-3]|uniref:YitT family protein n=1 Tax=Vagococcus allomyrinae TaxID=2794353 RepID=A0A940SX26_9ENTE|nr:YitT family protein [Vagococcus allomyrinae]MBP1043875.1 YitT family protein [Vagococcus allomyrinae]